MTLKQATIMANTPDYLKQLHQQIDQTPEEYRGLLLRIVHSFVEGVTLPSAKDSFSDGWRDVLHGNVHDIDTLWDDVNTPNDATNK